ncbi:MAG: tRNA (guanosine(37)-N1)-methyltransferase TrmD [Nitrospira sp.]|jgi:tRNA (guanine37-N1)-methyltransferase|nr:tRNA (guanosine(37)-N1)-methyltransferase TrmD [Nitrospira sp.]HQY58681.1 tRNA (guanosine(37)-N1)-methyltransferase TrmD [Nitrospira sp.]
MRCAVVTLFPEMVAPVLGQSILKRAQEKGLLEVSVQNLRDHTFDRHKTADDVPYGGGAGMVMKAEPVLQAIDALRTRYRASHPETTLRVIIPSPQGRPFTQELAQSLAQDERVVVFVCGHYEGMDERVRLALHPEEISVGDYVLTGGELPALVMIDAAARLVPGVLGDAASAAEESFTEGLLEYPHYTRPAEVRGMAVPEVLVSGHHEAIRLWRRKEALRNTYLKRPDLLRDRELGLEDRRLLSEVMQESLVQVPVR